MNNTNDILFIAFYPLMGYTYDDVSDVNKVVPKVVIPSTNFCDTKVPILVILEYRFL